MMPSYAPNIETAIIFAAAALFAIWLWKKWPKITDYINYFYSPILRTAYLAVMGFSEVIGFGMRFRVVGSCVAAVLVVVTPLLLSVLLFREGGDWLSRISVLRNLVFGILLVTSAAALIVVWKLYKLQSKMRIAGSILGFPVERASAYQAKGQDAELRIVHLSDLHVAVGPLTEGLKQFDQKRFKALITKVGNLCGNSPGGDTGVTAVVISGDLTDTGSEAEWRKLSTRLNANLPRKCAIIACPGNHDLNVVGYTTASLLCVGDDALKTHSWSRLKRYLEFVDTFMSPFTTTVDGQNFHTAWGNLKSSNLDVTASFHKAQQFFPLFCTPPGVPPGCCFVVWNSVRWSRLAWSNSFGELGSDQLKRFSEGVQDKNRAGLKLVHVMHHKLGLPSGGLSWLLSGFGSSIRAQSQAAGMILVDAGEAVGFLGERQNTIVLHGHHHSSFYGPLRARSNITVVSAPSSTLGTESFAPIERNPRIDRSFDILHVSVSLSGMRLTAPPQEVTY